MKLLLHPARVVSLVFLAVILVGTAILMLPMSQAEGISSSWVTAFLPPFRLSALLGW